ncbi:hypothetical protein [Sphingomonas sp. NIBR02145]|uniref:hypothetical protein n=1 Tax=Sphingomonas sp. NIBR02145 TaxID=3014784 RepID=UPI0022B55C88|nr:hypothetical protein [Sphingomonas sp. NIBR02145]WHU03264.1 hypothetical protein O3305_01220 [Sphingomonas sp. NIBR02145]
MTTRDVATWLVMAGLAIRLAWLVLVRGLLAPFDLGEASSAVTALARTGTLADAFGPGTGPTAHLMPTTIVGAAAVEHVFGDSAAASLILSLWTLALLGATWLLARKLFERAGWQPAALIGGLALLCLVPGHIVQEAADFRVWEGGLATLLALANLWLIVTLDPRETIAGQPLLVGAALSAATFFVSPTTGLAVDACWAWLALRRLPFPRALAFAATAAAALALVLAPWVLRNAQVMGSPILLRDNVGLEMALANYPGALDPADPLAESQARMQAIHPNDNEATQARLRAAGGEVAYSRALARETGAWIRANPLDFARLALRHYRQFYFPDRWQGALTNWEAFPTLRIDMIRLVAALGLAGLLGGLIRRRRFHGLFALYIALAGLPYALVQPVPRYAYAVWPLLAFLAAGLLVGIFARLQARGRIPMMAQ